MQDQGVNQEEHTTYWPSNTNWNKWNKMYFSNHTPCVQTPHPHSLLGQGVLCIHARYAGVYRQLDEWNNFPFMVLVSPDYSYYNENNNKIIRGQLVWHNISKCANYLLMQNENTKLMNKCLLFNSYSILGRSQNSICTQLAESIEGESLLFSCPIY